MKKLILIILFVPIVLTAQVRCDSMKILRDSICKLNQRPVMTVAQFVKVYKYDTLLKYYWLCKRKPVDWKFYRGWSARVFGDDKYLKSMSDLEKVRAFTELKKELGK